MGKIFTPHDYQTEALEHLYEHRRCALWMPMGGGKTVTTLTALENLSLIDEVYPALVLAPKRVARTTWPDEVAKWAHLNGLRVSVVVGSARERSAALKVPADIYAMNYDNLVWLRKEVGNNWPFKTVIADEFTRLKSFRLRQGGARAAALGQVAHKDVSRFIGLTGTPAPNGMKDLWGQIWFLDQGERLGRTFSAFQMRWFYKGYDGYSLQPFDHSQEEIQDKVKDICLTVRTGNAEEVEEHIIYVDLPPEARRIYKDMEDQMFVAIEENGLKSAFEVEASTAGVKFNKCRQIANGFLFGEDKQWVEIHDEKLVALESVIEEASGEPLLVAYVYVPDKERILKKFRTARFLDDNPQTVHDWNKGLISELVAHPASAGHGLNLQDGGHMMVDFGIDYNLEHDMQIIERIGPERQKQSGYDRTVYRYRIIARGTVEEWAVLPALQGKRSVQDLLLDAAERRKKNGTQA